MMQYLSELLLVIGIVVGLGMLSIGVKAICRNYLKNMSDCSGVSETGDGYFGISLHRDEYDYYEWSKDAAS